MNTELYISQQAKEIRNFTIIPDFCLPDLL
jgi:hypothetical protein